MFSTILFFFAKYFLTKYFRNTATTVKINQDANAVQNTVNSSANVTVNIAILSGKFIAVPIAVSLSDSFHAALSDLFILLTTQINLFVSVLMVSSISKTLHHKTSQ